MLGGIVCGYLRDWLGMVGIALQAVEVKRVILLLSCAIAFLGLLPVIRLGLPAQSETSPAAPQTQSTARWPRRWAWLRGAFGEWKWNPFLRRFLPLMAAWSGLLAAFNTFGNVYLSRQLHIQMTQIGLIFSTVQVLQLCMGLLAPIVFRLLGLVKESRRPR